MSIEKPCAPADCRKQDVHSSESGFALIAVLAALTLAGGLLASLSATSMNTFHLTGAQHDRIGEEQLLLGASRLLAAQHDADPSMPTVLCRHRDGVVAAHGQDHRGLIDLNAAGLALLEIGFDSLDTVGVPSRALAQAVIDFRSRDASGGQNVAIDHGLKRSRFEHVAELLDFTPLRAVPLDSLQSIFTVHTGSGTIMPALSPPGLRDALASARGAAAPFVKQAGGHPAVVTYRASRRPSGNRHGAGRMVRLVQKRAATAAGSRWQTVEFASRPMAKSATAQPVSGACPAWLADYLDRAGQRQLTRRQGGSGRDG